MTNIRQFGLILVCVLLVCVLLVWSAVALAQGDLNPAGEARYGWHALAPGFSPAPFVHDALSGGDIEVKTLGLGDNCLGYAASDPDFVIELSGDFKRVTFLIASAADTTLVINLPKGNWSCNDDTNGLNPALVFYDAPPGPYRVWIGSYAPEAFDESRLYVSEAGPETLPTTATGPDPGRDPLYGEASLSPGFAPTPWTAQLIGGGRSRADDFLEGEQCRGFVSEAPDFSLYLDGSFAEIWFAVYSGADMTLIVNAADGSWHCGDDHLGAYPALGFRLPPGGLYDIWVGSADEGNYAASILYAMESEPDETLEFVIDARCEGLPPTALQVGARARVTGAAVDLHAAPETASTIVARAAAGSLLSLVGGPICKEAHRWWRAELSPGVGAWVADGDAATRWLERQD